MAKEAARTLELMGLLGQLRPDCKTIADFRRDHGTAMKRVCREFTRRCTALDLFGGERLTIDGSKLQAVHGQQRNVSGRKRGRWIEASDAKIEAYLQQLDRQDAEEPPRRTPTAAQMQQKLAPWQARQPRYQRDQQHLQQRGENHMSRTDPASRTIRRGDSRLVGYHVHVAVDEQDTLSVEQEVTPAVPAQPQLVPLAARTTQP